MFSAQNSFANKPIKIEILYPKHCTFYIKKLISQLDNQWMWETQEGGTIKYKLKGYENEVEEDEIMEEVFFFDYIDINDKVTLHGENVTILISLA